MFSKSFIISIIAAVSYALPSGSPYCQIDDSNKSGFESNHGKESESPVFDAKFTPADAGYKISLSNKGTPIHGALLYVVGSDKKTHLGQFTAKPGFKFVTGCTGGSGSTITHENREEKKDTEFIWTPGPNEKGPFTLHALVTGNKVPWQMLTVNEEAKGDSPKGDSPKGDSPKTGAHSTTSQPADSKSTATSAVSYPSGESDIRNISFSGVESKKPVVFLCSLSALVVAGMLI